MSRRAIAAVPAPRRPAVEHPASDFVPRYYKVYAVLQRRIREGEWAAGAPMPTEEEFARAFRVSRVTVRKALAMLQDERLVTREQGRGTFALPVPKRPARTSFAGFLENVRDFERDTRVRVLSFARVALAAEVAEALSQHAGAPGLRIERVRGDGRGPFSVTTCHLPEPEAGLVTEQNLGNRTVTAVLEAAGVAPASADQTLSATAASVEVARRLKVDLGAPLISMRRLVRDAGGRPFELLEALYRPDRYEYRVNLSRDRESAGPRWIARI